MDEQERQRRNRMRDVVATMAQRTIIEYRKGRYNERDVANFLGELFEAANDMINESQPAQGDEKTEGANDA